MNGIKFIKKSSLIGYKKAIKFCLSHNINFKEEEPSIEEDEILRSKNEEEEMNFDLNDGKSSDLININNTKATSGVIISRDVSISSNTNENDKSFDSNIEDDITDLEFWK